MPIVQPATLELSVEQLLKLQGTAAQQSAVREAAEWACAEVARLAHPVALFDRFPV